MNASDIAAFCCTLTPLQMMAHVEDLITMVDEAGKSEFNLPIETNEVSSDSELEIVSSVDNRRVWKKLGQKARRIRNTMLNSITLQTHRVNRNHRMISQTHNETTGKSIGVLHNNIKLTDAVKNDIPKIATFANNGEVVFISERKCKYQQHHTSTSSEWDANADQSNRFRKDKRRREHPKAKQSNPELVLTAHKNEYDPIKSRGNQIFDDLLIWTSTKEVNNNGMVKTDCKIRSPPLITVLDRRNNDEYKEMSVKGGDDYDVSTVIYHRVRRKLNLENV
jgi:hypothetical protein